MRRRRVVLAALLAAACVAAGAAAQGDPQAHHLTHAHHHEGAAGGAPASDVAEYTKAVGVRLQEIHERFFPAEKRKAGMTQAEFAEAAKQMMQTLSTDPLYTANVSAAAGAARPQFDWPWTRNYRVADGYYLHMGWRRANKTFWGTTNRFAVAGTSDWDDRRPHILGEWSDVPQNCSKGSPGFVWTRSCAPPPARLPPGSPLPPLSLAPAARPSPASVRGASPSESALSRHPVSRKPPAQGTGRTSSTRTATPCPSAAGRRRRARTSPRSPPRGTASPCASTTCST